MLSEREATPLAVKLGAAAEKEDGNPAAAIELLQAAKQQVNAEAQALLEALDREIERLGG